MKKEFVTMEEKEEGVYGFTKYPFLDDVSILDQLYQLIDCSVVEFTEIGNGVDIISDEEALLSNGEKILTEIYFPELPEPLRIFGKIVLVGADEEGKTIPITESQLEWFKSLDINIKLVRVG